MLFFYRWTKCKPGWGNWNCSNAPDRNVPSNLGEIESCKENSEVDFNESSSSEYCPSPEPIAEDTPSEHEQNATENGTEK